MEMSLIVFFGLLAGVLPVESVIQVTGDVGRSAVIRCPYDKGYEGYSKYLCRGSCPIIGGKDIPIRTKDGQTKATEERFSLHDNTTAGLFTVSITGLTEADSGQYWCGVKTGPGKSDVYTELKLDVSPVLPPLPLSTLVPSTEDHTLSSLSSSSSSSFSSSSSSSPTPTSNTSQTQHVLNTTITDQDTAADDQEVEAEDSVITVIPYLLVLLVIGLMCGFVSALYYRQRRRKQTAVCGPTSLQHVEEDNNDYEMIEEPSSIPMPRASVSSLYFLADAPHRPSVISLYSTVKPVTQSSEQPIYSNSQEDNLI